MSLAEQSQCICRAFWCTTTSAQNLWIQTIISEPNKSAKLKMDLRNRWPSYECESVSSQASFSSERKAQRFIAPWQRRRRSNMCENILMRNRFVYRWRAVDFAFTHLTGRCQYLRHWHGVLSNSACCLWYVVHLWVIFVSVVVIDFWLDVFSMQILG